jgi:hypothetical protein
VAEKAQVVKAFEEAEQIIAEKKEQALSYLKTVEETQRALLIDDDQTFIDNLRSQLPQCEISETFSRYKTSLIQTERALSLGDVTELRFVHDLEKLRKFGQFLHGDTNLMNPSEITVSSVEKSKASIGTCIRDEKGSSGDSHSQLYKRVLSLPLPRLHGNRLPRRVNYKI